MNKLWTVFGRFLGWACAFSLAMNLIQLAPSLFMLHVFDRVFTSRSVETLELLALASSLWLLCGLVLDIVRQRLLARAAGHLDDGCSEAMMRDLLSAAAHPERGHDTGPLRDLATVRGFLSGPAVHALFDAPWIFVYIGVIAMFDLTLATIASFSALLFVLLALLSDRMSAPSIRRSQQCAASAGTFLQSGLRAGEAISAHGMSQGIAKQWLRHHQQGMAEARAAAATSASFGAISRFLRQLLQIIMLGIGAWLVIEHRALPGVTIAATILLGRMLAPLESLSANWKNIAEARMAWERLASRVAQVAATDTAAFDLPAPSGRIEVQNLVFAPRDGAAPTLKHVSFDIQPGEVVAIIGASGSGKSTLARALIGLWKPQAGAVRLDGVDLVNWPREALGPHIGYCPQDVQLVTGTVAQNIARFTTVSDEDVVAAARRAQCHDLIARLPGAYDTEVGEGGARLSGGQRQRIALARALFGNPRLVVLDEPNANLDSAGENALEQVIDTLRATGVTTVIITQRMPVVEQADKVLILNDGKVERYLTKHEGKKPDDPNSPPGNHAQQARPTTNVNMQRD